MAKEKGGLSKDTVLLMATPTQDCAADDYSASNSYGLDAQKGLGS